jgi:hypothetical protein
MGFRPQSESLWSPDCHSEPLTGSHTQLSPEIVHTRAFASLNKHKAFTELGMVVHTCNPGTLEAEGGGS